MRRCVMTLKEAMKKLRALDRSVAKLIQERNAALAEVRRNCKHLRLVELDYHKGVFSTNPPRRICKTCGAEEVGCGCGYQVLVTQRERTGEAIKKLKRGATVSRTREGVEFYRYRRGWLCYFVGQSHSNFAGTGQKTYEQLTEIAA